MKHMINRWCAEAMMKAWYYTGEADRRIGNLRWLAEAFYWLNLRLDAAWLRREMPGARVYCTRSSVCIEEAVTLPPAPPAGLE